MVSIGLFPTTPTLKILYSCSVATWQSDVFYCINDSSVVGGVWLFLIRVRWMISLNTQYHKEHSRDPLKENHIL